MQTGKLITFEGSEGAGKSINLAWAAEWLRARGMDVLTTREPGGTLVAEQIRAVLLNPDLPAMHPETELLLMFAARHEHIQQKIVPALQAGRWVLCDRFTDASYAYQGFGRGVALERIAQLEAWALGSLHPDYTILLDIEVALGMSRAKARGAMDRIEQEALSFFERVRQGYLFRAVQYPERYAIVDASVELQAVRTQLEPILQHLLDKV